MREASEKRRYRRELVARSVYIRFGGEVLPGEVQDVSASGARFLLAPDSAPRGLGLGTALTVVIEPLAVEIDGHVARITGEEVAVAFDGLSPETESALARGIAEAAHHDDPAE